MLAASLFCPRQGADDGLLTAVVSRVSDELTATTWCCADKFVLQLGTLRPTDNLLLSTGHTSDVTFFKDIFTYVLSIALKQV